jgi:hypothetical protein
MDRRAFNIIERIVRQALYQGATDTLVRHVGNLLLVIEKEARTAPADARPEPERQAGVIGALLAPHLARRSLLNRVGQEATPETLRRRLDHPVERLMRRHDWEIEYGQAVEEIAAVYMAMSEGLMPTADLYRLRVSDGTRRVYRQPWERVTESRHRQFRDHYEPWAREMDALPANLSARGRQITVSSAGSLKFRQFPGRSVLGVVIDVVIHGYQLGEIDDLLGIRHGRTADMVVEALDRYAQIAGWVAGPAPIPASASQRGRRAAARASSAG